MMKLKDMNRDEFYEWLLGLFVVSALLITTTLLVIALWLL